MKIGIIGLGKMGEALLEGLRRVEPGGSRVNDPKGEFSITATTRSDESAREAAKRLKISCHTDNAKLARESDVVVLCVKPHQAKAVLGGMKPAFGQGKLLISICAAVTTEQVSAWSGAKAAVIRAMPNTPAVIGRGMTVYCAGPGCSKEQLAIAERIFGAVGKTALIEEALMDGATGLSGCGPAYVFLVIESLSEAGVKVGLPRGTATLLAAQTLAGASEMVLARGEHPAALKDEVTTPAGCTIDGLMALEEGKLRVTLIKAVLAAAKRSRSLRVD